MGNAKASIELYRTVSSERSGGALLQAKFGVKNRSLHLPVAGACNVQCNFCNRKYDCLNESRPGVISALLTPEQAIAYTKQAVQRMPNISVVGIAGPGDPFASVSFGKMVRGGHRVPHRRNSR